MSNLHPLAEVAVGLIAIASGGAALRWPWLLLLSDPNDSRMIKRPAITKFDYFRNWWVLKGLPIVVMLIPGMVMADPDTDVCGHCAKKVEAEGA